METTTIEEPCDPERVAARAGLIRRGDDRPGIRRRRAGRGFTYVDRSGRRISDATRTWVESLAIPPAWTDVWVSPERDSHLLASGIDAAGRKQYRYHPAWIDAANAAKFERLAGFPRPLAKLRASVADALRTCNDDDWVCAAIVRLIDQTLIRPGSFRNFHQRGTVGAVSLHADHITVSRRRIQLSFVGKSDVPIDVVCQDPLLARRLTELVEHAGGDGPLFADDVGRIIDAAELNAYIQRHAGDRFTAKDLRTWGATTFAAEQLVVCAPGDGSDAEADIRSAIAAAAERLGNTVAVCRSAYVAPALLEAHRAGTLSVVWRRSRRAQWLSRAERTVARVLADGSAPSPSVVAGTRD